MAAHFARRVRFKGNERLATALGNFLKIFQAGIRLVRADFANIEVLAGFLEQRDELRTVGGVFVENANRCYHVSLDSTSDMGLDPDTFRSGDPVLLIVPFFVSTAAEPARINGELRLDGAEGTGAVTDQLF